MKGMRARRKLSLVVSTLKLGEKQSAQQKVQCRRLTRLIAERGKLNRNRGEQATMGEGSIKTSQILPCSRKIRGKWQQADEQL